MNKLYENNIRMLSESINKSIQNKLKVVIDKLLSMCELDVYENYITVEYNRIMILLEDLFLEDTPEFKNLDKHNRTCLNRILKREISKGMRLFYDEVLKKYRQSEIKELYLSIIQGVQERISDFLDQECSDIKNIHIYKNLLES